MTGQEQPPVPLPAELIEVALKAFLDKKIELHSDGDTALERGRTEAIAVLAAVAAAAPFFIELGAQGNAGEPAAAAAELPTTTGAVITYRGRHGFPWLGFLTGNGTWNVIRQDTWEGYKPREVAPAELLDEVGWEFTVLRGGLK